MQSRLSFHMMFIEFHVRDWLRPPARVLQSAGIQPGMQVLDFGCGPGGFSVAAARLVGPQGRVWAVDIHPLALEAIGHAVRRHRLENLRALPADCLEEVPENGIDMILLYDVLHDLQEPERILSQLNRKLRPAGRLSVKDHHLGPQEIISAVTGNGPFRYQQSARWTHQFERCGDRRMDGDDRK